MSKDSSKPSVALIALLLTATAASAVLIGTAQTEEDTVAHVLFTIALLVFTACCVLVRHRDRRAQEDSRRGKPAGGS